jgi:hypothetical protein
MHPDDHQAMLAHDADRLARVEDLYDEARDTLDQLELAAPDVALHSEALRRFRATFEELR